MSLLLVTGLAWERWLLRRLLPVRLGLRIEVAGPGQRAAGAKLLALLAQHRPDLVFGVGFCGSLTPSARPRTLAVPNQVLSPNGACLGPTLVLRTAAPTGRLVSAPAVVSLRAEKARLRQATGADWVDLESYGWLSTAKRLAVPMAIVRVVLDGADEELPVWHKPRTWSACGWLPPRMLQAAKVLAAWLAEELGG